MSIISLLKKILSHSKIILFLAGLILLLGAGMIFWQYVFSVVFDDKNTLPPAPKTKLEIKMDLYDKIMSNLKERENNILESETKNYRDIFK